MILIGGDLAQTAQGVVLGTSARQSEECRSGFTSRSRPGGVGERNLDPQKLTTDNSLNLSVVTTGGTQTFGPYGKHSSGDNFVTIEANPGIEIMSVTLTDSSGFEDLKQPRISGAGITPVPEISSMILLGTGVLLFAKVLRRNLWQRGNGYSQARS